MTSKIKIELKQYLTEKGFEGCRDGNCIVRHNTGMVTNGRCGCLENMSRIQQKRLYHYTNEFYQTKLTEQDKLLEQNKATLRECSRREAKLNAKYVESNDVRVYQDQLLEVMGEVLSEASKVFNETEDDRDTACFLYPSMEKAEIALAQYQSYKAALQHNEEK